MNQKFILLHISDLHIRNDGQGFDRSVVLDPLLKRVKEDAKNGLKPEIIVVTGDVAYQGIQTEYELAQKFLDDLLDAAALSSREKMFIVPGNHDVNRKKYRPRDIPNYRNMQELNEELGNNDYRKDLLKGMKDYFQFIRQHYSHLQPIKANLIPFLSQYSTADKKIGLIGLNSAWMCRKSPDEKEIAIGEFQIKTAGQELEKLGQTDLDIYLLHHPLPYLWPEDATICRSYLKGEKSLLLSGHLHQPGGMMGEDLQGRLMQFQAGGAYLGSSESTWPGRFHHITIDWKANSLQLDFRAYDKSTRKWHVDAKTGNDGTKKLPLFPHATKKSRGSGRRVSCPAQFPSTYRAWIIENYQHLDAEKLYGSEMVPLSLPEIFIPLSTRSLLDKKRKGRETPAGIKEADIETDVKEQQAINLEALVASRASLLIEGHPGSGKTTVMKHITYCLAQSDRRCAALAPIQGYLPVLIFLKNLNDYFGEIAAPGRSCSHAFDIIDWYAQKKMGQSIDPIMIQAFIKQQRAIVLLDGLDELLPEHRDVLVKHFADLKIKYPGNRLVLTSRPHGISPAAVQRFQKDHVKIEALSMAQVEEFITKWFGYFYRGERGPGGRTAQAMMNEVRSHPTIGKLIENPLMLTAVCILYHDQKELPAQRAELYKRFVDNMLYRRFGNENTNVQNYLKTLAFFMHTTKTKKIDEHNALVQLMRVYKAEEKEDSMAYNTRLKSMFGEIEAKCGLLKFEAGQYEFWHLTFQEFLTADYISDNEVNLVVAMAPYWDDEWYREMVELYISYISIRNKAVANTIVTKALASSDQKRWLKAAAALYDIQKDLRDEQVLDKTRQRLLAIFQTEEIIDRRILAEAGELLGWLGDPRDLKALVRIDGGTFELEGLGECTIESFEIGKYPVHNGWYEEFISAAGYGTQSYWSDEGWQWREKNNMEYPVFWHDRKWKCPNAPVIGVSFWEAQAFCRWLTSTANDGQSYRLPQAWEWLYAAAGCEQRKYPWGNEDDASRCNCYEGNDVIGNTSAVGIFERGKTSTGLYDMAGNVFEWCIDCVAGSDRMLCGGSWINLVSDCRSAVCYGFKPDVRGDGIGFRFSRGHKELKESASQQKLEQGRTDKVERSR